MNLTAPNPARDHHDNPPNSVNWFEIPVNIMDQARNFYEKVLGVKLKLVPLGALTMAWFPWSQGAPGSAGTLMKAKSYVPSHDWALCLAKGEHMRVPGIGVCAFSQEMERGWV